MSGRTISLLSVLVTACITVSAATFIYKGMRCKSIADSFDARFYFDTQYVDRTLKGDRVR